MNDNFKQAFENAAKIAPDTLPLETIDEATIFGDGNDIISDITTPPPPPPPVGNNNQLGGQQQPQQGQQAGQQGQNFNLGVIPPEIAVSVIDTAGSTIVAVACRLAGMDVRAKQLQLNSGERKMMEQPTEMLLKSLDIYLTPLEVFGATLLSIYAKKVIEIHGQQQDREPIDINDRNELSNEKKPRKPRNDAGKPRAKRS